jgi:hypothetical protein
MDRIHGVTASCAFVRKLDFAPNQTGFDAAFPRRNSSKRLEIFDLLEIEAS